MLDVWMNNSKFVRIDLRSTEDESKRILVHVLLNKSAAFDRVDVPMHDCKQGCHWEAEGDSTPLQAEY